MHSCLSTLKSVFSVRLINVKLSMLHRHDLTVLTPKLLYEKSRHFHHPNDKKIKVQTQCFVQVTEEKNNFTVTVSS